MSSKKALIGMLAGIAAGAALGILFAPDKGSRTRRNIKRKGEDLMDLFNDKIDEKFDELMDIVKGRARTPESSGKTNPINRPPFSSEKNLML